MRHVGIAFLCLFASLIAAGGCLQKSENSNTESWQKEIASNAAGPICVKCVIEFNGRRERIESEVELSRENATAFEALNTLAKKNGLGIKSSGAGESLFVVAVGDFANEGAGGKNWVYKVDGKLGDRSSGVFKVSPSQQVQWSLGAYP